MAHLLSFAGFKRTPERRDWSAQELAEFYRVQDALGRLGLPIETDRGLSDEHEPWFAFCSADGGEVLVHFARIDGFYIVASALLPQVLKGLVFRDVIDQFLAAQPVMLAPAPVVKGPRRVLMHPSALLTALVLTVYLLFESHREVRADMSVERTERAAEPQGLIAKLMAQVQSWFGDDASRAGVERMAPQMAFLAVAVALIQDRDVGDLIGVSPAVLPSDTDEAPTDERTKDDQRVTAAALQQDQRSERPTSAERPAEVVEATPATGPAREEPALTIATAVAEDMVPAQDLPAPIALSTALTARPAAPLEAPGDAEAPRTDVATLAEKAPAPESRQDTAVVQAPRTSAQAEFSAIVMVLHASGQVEFRAAGHDDAVAMLALLERMADTESWRDHALEADIVGVLASEADIKPADVGALAVEAATSPVGALPPVTPLNDPVVTVPAPSTASLSTSASAPTPAATTPTAPPASTPTSSATNALPANVLQDLVARFVKIAGNAEFVVDRGSIIVFDPDVFKGSNIGSMTIKQYEFADGSDITLVGLPADIAMLG